MSDVEIVLGALSRIELACRSVSGVGSAAPVSPQQARILRHLDEVDPVMVTELADFIGVTASTMSLNLKRLQDAGLILRDRDPDDRRVMNVRLSPAGARAREASEVLDPRRVDALLRTLRPDERRRAVDGLARLAQGADALATRRGDHGVSRAGGGER